MEASCFHCFQPDLELVRLEYRLLFNVVLWEFVICLVIYLMARLWGVLGVERISVVAWYHNGAVRLG